MPFIQDKNAGIFTIKVNIGEYFNLEAEDLYVELREPKTEEAMKFMPKGTSTEESQLDMNVILEVIPGCIIDHNFYSDAEETKKMATKDVWRLILDRMGCSMDVVTTWSNNIPLAKKKQTA